DGVNEFGRNIGTQIAEPSTIALSVRGAQPIDVCALVWECPSEQIKEQHAEAVEIARHGGGFAGEHFRSEIHRGAGDARRIAALRSSRTKVHEDDAPARFAHNVLRLDV